MEPLDDGIVVLHKDAQAALKEKDAEIACLKKRIERYKEDAEDRAGKIEKQNTQIAFLLAVDAWARGKQNGTV